MIYLNGKFISAELGKIDFNDRGFLLGDGLFETMRAYQGKTPWLKEHWQRLEKSAGYLEIPLIISFDELGGIINELLSQNNLLAQDASLRLTVTRGSGPRGLLPPNNVKPTLMLTAFGLPAFEVAAVDACVVNIRRNELSPLANIKSLNYLENVLAKMAAVKLGSQEAILLNSKNHVAEASAANIFCVTEKMELITPRIEDGALPGITRQVVIHLAEKLNIPIAEKIVNVDDLTHAAEIFLTNSLIEIQPVGRFNGKIINKNSPSIVEILQNAYRERMPSDRKEI